MRRALAVIVAVMTLAAPAAMSQEAATAATPVTPAVPAPTADHYLADGKWTYPNTDVMANNYPAKAVENRQGGTVALDCELDHEGYVVACRILSEDPKGYDFGYITASMFINYARVAPATVTGGLKDGDRKSSSIAGPFKRSAQNLSGGYT